MPFFFISFSFSADTVFSFFSPLRESAQQPESFIQTALKRRKTKTKSKQTNLDASFFPLSTHLSDFKHNPAKSRLGGRALVEVSGNRWRNREFSGRLLLTLGVTLCSDTERRVVAPTQAQEQHLLR